MNFDFTDEQKLFAEQVRRFAQDHLAAGALKRVHDPRFPYDVAQPMTKQGLMGITLPEHDGGQGGTLMDVVIAIEQVAAICPRRTDVVQFGNFGPPRLRRIRQRSAEEALARRAVGQPHGHESRETEPDAGSAVTDLKTSARSDGSHYIINGKNWLR